MVSIQGSVIIHSMKGINMITITTSRGNQASFRMHEPKPKMAHKIIRLEATGEEREKLIECFAGLPFPRQEGRKPEERVAIFVGDMANHIWINI
jgi:hypothetical protein